jgi:hypothetical protein
MLYFIHKLFRPDSIVYRLVYAKKSSSEYVVSANKLNTQEIEMKKMQQQMEIMSKRVDKLMELLWYIPQSTEQQICSTIE